MRPEIPQLPLSPYDEGFGVGLLNSYTVDEHKGEQIVHQDLLYDLEINVTLIHRSDFIKGVLDGVRLSKTARKLDNEIIGNDQPEYQIHYVPGLISKTEGLSYERPEGV